MQTKKKKKQLFKSICFALREHFASQNTKCHPDFTYHLKDAPPSDYKCLLFNFSFLFFSPFQYTIDSSKSGLDLPKDGVLLQKSVWLKYKAHTCGRICVTCTDLSRVSLRSMAFNMRSYFRTILVDRPDGFVLIGYRLRPAN